MSFIKYLLAGVLFGIILIKSEVVSWFRIQEMFHFQSFHMFGVIGSAVLTGVVSLWLLKKLKLKSIEGEEIKVKEKTFNKGNVLGGLIFGFGWALTGACPGPIYAQVGAGFLAAIFTLLSAIGGVWVYGKLKEKLPH